MTIVLQFLQVIIALGLLNVWLIRARWATPYRGGNATTMEEEFRVYGLSRPVMLAVGALKVSMAILLLAGLWYPLLARIAATVIVLLMVGAVLMHLKVGDSLRKTMPATAVLVMAAIVMIYG